MQEAKNEHPEPEEQSKPASSSQQQVLKMGKLLVSFPCCMIRKLPEIQYLWAYYYFIGFTSPRFVQALFESTCILWQEVPRFMFWVFFNMT